MHFTDQTGHHIVLPSTPKRIVSLVPSQTEFLYDLGLADSIVGITKFCVHPSPRPKGFSIIGGTKNPNIGRIEALRPDLIVANKEENRKEDIEAMRNFCPVWTSDVRTIDDAKRMMLELGVITQSPLAESITVSIDKSLLELSGLVSKPHASALYLIWRKPYMAAGKDTFIHTMMQLIGLDNLVGQDRYPVLEPEEIQRLSPSFILLSSEPYPFKEAHKSELQDLCPNSKIILVDGEIFSWYGSRLLHVKTYFERELRPQFANR